MNIFTLTKKTIFIICITALAVVLSALTITHSDSRNQPTKAIQQNLRQFQASGVSFKYPEGYIEQAKTKSQVNQAKTLVKLAGDDPVRIIEVAKETGAIIGANATHTNFLDFLEGSAARGFPVRYKGYKPDQTKRISISGHDGSVITFNYTGTDGKTTLYMHFFIVPVGKDAYYVTVQSTDQSRAESDAQTFQDSFQID